MEEIKYYVFITNNEINGKGQCECSGDDTFSVEVTQEVYSNLDHYIWDGTDVILNPNYEQEHAEKEAKRIGELTMTALDFITFLRQCGLTLEQIRAYLDNNLELDTQLQYCQNVYCKVARSVMPITVGDITITSEMVEYAFKLKNGEIKPIQES